MIILYIKTEENKFSFLYFISKQKLLILNILFVSSLQW